MKPNQDRKRRNYNKIFDSAKKASGIANALNAINLINANWRQYRSVQIIQISPRLLYLIPKEGINDP